MSNGRLWLGLLLASLFQFHARADEVLVFAAASLTDALKEIASQYGSLQADRIVFNLDASSTLVRQIEAGAPADIFFSADEAKMDQLQAKGLIVEATRRSVLSNTLVLVAPREGGPSLHSPVELTNDAVERIALASPEIVPAGIYAKAYLQKKELWDRVAPKIIPTENVRAALVAVESGNADAAFVYKTDAAMSTDAVVVYVIPAAEAPSITYPVAIIKASENAAAASRFLNHLESPEAAHIFEKFGFTVLVR